jgi:prevent-host-death family protein
MLYLAAPLEVRDFTHGMHMIDITSDIQSLTTFRRASGDFMKQLKKTKHPVVLTVNGKAAAVVQDAEAYQRLLDIAARADADEGSPGPGRRYPWTHSTGERGI